MTSGRERTSDWFDTPVDEPKPSGERDELETILDAAGETADPSCDDSGFESFLERFPPPARRKP